MSPPGSFILDITFSAAGSAAAGMYVWIRNETTRELVKQKMDANGVVVYDLANLSSGYSEGDRIVCYVAGFEYGVADAYTVVLTDNGKAIAISGTAESATISPKVIVG